MSRESYMKPSKYSLLQIRSFRPSYKDPLCKSTGIKKDLTKFRPVTMKRTGLNVKISFGPVTIQTPGLKDHLSGPVMLIYNQKYPLRHIK